MRNFLFLAVFLFCRLTLEAQADSATLKLPEPLSSATFKSKNLVIDMTNAEEVDLALKNIHKYRYVEAITLEGQSDPGTLKKLFYRLSVLRNLGSLTLKENELLMMPENIGAVRIRTLTVEGNTGLDYNDLFTSLKNLPLEQLNLVDNDLRKTPASISEIKTLRKFQVTGSNQLDYEVLVNQLAKLPVLTTLSIPVNYINELPRNIDKLLSLQVLDVSHNNLTELPREISGLKAINNLSIQGNLMLNPAKDLEKLKGNNIQYLSLDKEISGEEIEQIKKLFPSAQVEFPVSRDENVKDPVPTAPAPVVFSGELKAKKELRILSPAYSLYAALFRGLEYNFDTLTFEQRYKDLRYENTSQIVNNGAPRRRTFHFRRSAVSYEHMGKKNEIWFRFAVNNRLISFNYPELRAFNGMYWVYKGPLTKKQFIKQYIKRKQRPEVRNRFGRIRRKQMKRVEWNDIRLELDKNNNLFTIEVKSDSGYSRFVAYPVIPRFPIESSQQTYYRRFDLYQKGLNRRAQKFRSDQRRSRARYDINYKLVRDFAWKELQSRMSNDEKLMSREDWLNYYDDIIANEEKLLNGAPLTPLFITRALTLKGYNMPLTTNAPAAAPQLTVVTTEYGTRNVNIDFVDSRTGARLVVSNIMIIDNKNKTTSQVGGTLGILPNLLTLRQYASYSILVQLRNGNWGAVNASELDRQFFEGEKTYQLNTTVFDRNFDTIGDLLNSGLN